MKCHQESNVVTCNEISCDGNKDNISYCRSIGDTETYRKGNICIYIYLQFNF